ncbi:MAG TPA: hypothetical protein VJ123_01950 [Anaerolineales bacterium]|nr:hypothetical protein [Anaerolineales bacterium]
MDGRRDRRWAGAAALAVALATAIPYILASALARDGSHFSGLLYNPYDGFSYLAKMRQGEGGAWLFTLSYAADPGPGTFLFVFYLFLGHLARWMGLPRELIYHAARVLGALAMFYLAYLFYEHSLSERRARWAAYGLTLLGSGLGWLALTQGVVSSDLWIPESVPFMSAYVNAHFPFASALLLAAVLITTRADALAKWKYLAAILVGLLLGAIQPFALGVLMVVMGGWLLWELFMVYRSGGLLSALRGIRTRALALLSVLAGAAPWLIYDAWVVTAHPVLKIWSAQNQTPSPVPLHYALGYGIVFVLALLGIARGRVLRESKGRLLVAWLVINALALYAPTALQRRLSLGLYFPMAALAGPGLCSILSVSKISRLAIVATVLLATPTNLVVILGGLGEAQRPDSSFVISSDEMAGFRWLDEHAAPGALVLAGPRTGNRLPAYASVRVLYGHPFETPHAQEEEALVRRFYAWADAPEDALTLLQARGIDFVVYGPEERALGKPAWLASLPGAFRAGSLAIYAVPTP